MASTYPNRQTFIGSLVSFLQKYGLDGVDIDWEYPGASDRGGIPADTDNFVLLMSEIQETFARTNPGWEATITVPTSYWYLRGFDINRLQKYVSWFNVMSYDLASIQSARGTFWNQWLTFWVARYVGSGQSFYGPISSRAYQYFGNRSGPRSSLAQWY